MSRDQRVADNWALLYAQCLADKFKSPLAVVFNLVPEYLQATLRQYEFMLKGLEQIENKLRKLAIPIFLLTGSPEKTIPKFVKENNVAALVTDFNPLKINRKWKTLVVDRITIPFCEVDAHNIIPVWRLSVKQEYAAYTIRPKVKRLLDDYLVDYPEVSKQKYKWPGKLDKIDWIKARKKIKVDKTVDEVSWLKPGEDNAINAMFDFLGNRLADYDNLRNDPSANGQSNLSPYLHFGQLSAQRLAFEALKYDRDIVSQEAFLEELIVRRELADNFCYYNENYDTTYCFPDWAAKTLDKHRRDKREYIYTEEQFERGLTFDVLWNAAQLEMKLTGKMHGYMRMYWAKKILEWTGSAKEAMELAIYLNDKYELDGRDPNGYAGIAWSIGGVHDRAWPERRVFGKIRYMSYDGCKRKFDIAEYIANIKKQGGKKYETA